MMIDGRRTRGATGQRLPARTGAGRSMARGSIAAGVGGIVGGAATGQRLPASGMGGPRTRGPKRNGSILQQCGGPSRPGRRQGLLRCQWLPARRPQLRLPARRPGLLRCQWLPARRPQLRLPARLLLLLRRASRAQERGQHKTRPLPGRTCMGWRPMRRTPTAKGEGHWRYGLIAD